MPKIKLTKSELKKQRDDLKRFTRFLPTLQLKKQQLQLELRRCTAKMKEIRDAESAQRGQLDAWIALFASPGTEEKICGILSLDEVRSSMHNIAGVDVPVFESAEFSISEYDCFIEESWINDALKVVKDLAARKAELDIVSEQHRRLHHELRVTTQKVNLFEKVKIPECKENIRVIRIYLGDQDTAAVCRAKIAKSKMQDAA